MTDEQFHNALNLVLQGYTVPCWIDSERNSRHKHIATAKRTRDTIEIYCFGDAYASAFVFEENWTENFKLKCTERNVQFMPEYAIKQAKH